MAKNNHFSCNFSNLDKLLNEQNFSETDTTASYVYGYARCMAEIEGVIAVVSDIGMGTSRIFCGAFAEALNMQNYNEEDSIWEKKILQLMPEKEREEKYIAELRFFHFLRRTGAAGKHYCMMSKLKFETAAGEATDVLHRMYYIFENQGNAVRYAICLYGPLSVDFKGKSVAVNLLTGECEELTSVSDSNIMSRREREVLSLVDSGMKSREIAERLHISVHTVSRHRQEILTKLQVKNSLEACRRARSMALI